MKKKERFIIFSPYFGKLPINFKLWVNSCSFNKDFKFVVFTDDNIDLSLPTNVEIINISFNDFCDKIQKKFDFKLALNTPYKLCDFKPVFGYIFSDIIDGYDYWGHCDLDLIFGNLSKFLPTNLLEFDKISYLGHFCMYKNKKRVNEIFKKTPQNTISYIDILSNDQHFGFDEIGDYCINNILKENELKIYNYNRNVADISCKRKKMTITKYDGKNFSNDRKEKIFVFDNGIIKSFDVKKLCYDSEYAYVHFQKRKMIDTVKNYNHFIITAKSFLDYQDINSSTVLNLTIDRFIDLSWIKFKVNAIKRRLRRYICIKKIMNSKGDKA